VSQGRTSQLKLERNYRRTVVDTDPPDQNHQLFQRRKGISDYCFHQSTIISQVIIFRRNTLKMRMDFLNMVEV